jgi:hypothetical protein
MPHTSPEGQLIRQERDRVVPHQRVSGFDNDDQSVWAYGRAKQRGQMAESLHKWGAVVFK